MTPHLPSEKPQLDIIDDKKKPMYKRVLRFLILWDGLWSIPVGVITFIGYGFFGNWYFGPEFGFYNPVAFHAAIYAAVILIVANTVAFLGMYFNFRAIWKFYYCYSAEAFNNLSGVVKILIFLGMYILYVAAFLFTMSILL